MSRHIPCGANGYANDLANGKKQPALRGCGFNAAHLELVTAVGDLPPEALFPPFCLSAMCLCFFEGARDCS